MGKPRVTGMFKPYIPNSKRRPFKKGKKKYGQNHQR